MNYRFEIDFEKRNLTPEQDAECEKFISYWVERLKLCRVSETKVVREVTDDTDLTKACIFTSKVKNNPLFFRKVTVSDLIDGETEVYINNQKPKGLAAMSDEEIDAKLERGYNDILEGKSQPAEEAFSEIRESFFPDDEYIEQLLDEADREAAESDVRYTHEEVMASARAVIDEAYKKLPEDKH